MSRNLAVMGIGLAAIDVEGRRLGPSTGRIFALLLYLALRRGQPASRLAIRDLLFPESLRHRSAHNLRQLLYRLKQLALPVEADDDHVRLLPAAVSIDWLALLDRGEFADVELEQLTQGLFPGYDPEISDAFREWFDGERRDITARLSRALTTYIAQLRRAGRWDAVDVAARALLALDPLSEEGTLAKAEALALAGSKSAALGVIDGYLEEVGAEQPRLQHIPSVLKRRISERLPDTWRAADERLFVGREEAMSLLSSLGAATRAGSQQVLLLWGAAGIGKTRLLAEYRAFAALQGGLTLSLSAHPHDCYHPLGIVCELAARLLGAPGALGCDPAARALLQRLVNADRQVDGEREASVAEVSTAALVRSLNDLIGAVAVECPLQIVVDDAQWMDDNSRTVILGAFADRTTRRSSLILVSRERTTLDELPVSPESVLSTRLDPLDHEASLALTHNLLQGSLAADRVAVASQVVAQARGNPFVIRTLCAHYLSTNDRASLNATLADILARRLGRLSGNARRTLETAIVLARNCTFERLERVLAAPRERILAAVEELDDQGLLEVTDGCLASGHALLAEAVNRRMAESVQRLLHGAAAELLQRETEHAGSGPLLWDCAEHWRLAGNAERAVAVLLECANRAHTAGRSGDAIVTIRRALTLDMSDDRRLSIVENALMMNWRSGFNVELPYLLAELRRLRLRTGRPIEVHDEFELVELGAVKHYDPSVDEREVTRRLLLCLAAPSASPTHRVFAAFSLMTYAETLLDRDLAERTVSATRGLELPPDERALFEMIYHCGYGDPVIGRARANEVLVAAQSVSPIKMARLVNAAIAQYRVEQPAVAEQSLRTTLAMSTQNGFLAGRVLATCILARLYWSTERLAESSEYHQLAENLLTHYADQEITVMHCVLGARLAIVRRELDVASGYIQRARVFPHAQAELHDSWLRCCEIDIRLARGGEVTDEEVKHLEAVHHRARGLGLHDEVVATLLACLDMKGRSEEGTALLREYVREHRRDGFPVPSWLARRRENPVRRSARTGRDRQFQSHLTAG